MIVKITTPQDAPFVRGKLRFGLKADGEFGLSTGQIDPALGNQLVTVTNELLHSRGPEHMSLQALAHVVVSIGYSPLSGVIVEQGMSKSAFPMAMSDAIIVCARETGRPRLLEIADHIQTPGILYDRPDIFSENQQSSQARKPSRRQRKSSDD